MKMHNDALKTYAKICSAVVPVLKFPEHKILMYVHFANGNFSLNKQSLKVFNQYLLFCKKKCILIFLMKNSIKNASPVLYLKIATRERNIKIGSGMLKKISKN